MGNNYTDRIKAVIVVIFFHYLGYVIFLLFDALKLNKKVHLSFNLRKGFSYLLGSVMTTKQTLSETPASENPAGGKQ